jgi:hypothetical protein
MTPGSFLRPFAAFTAATFLLASSPAAFAQVGKEGIAEGLFQEGKKLLDQGNVPGACQKFKASLDTDKTLGTLIALAACHEKEGKTASAWAEFTEAAALAKKDGKADLEAYSRGRVGALDKQLSRLTINATKVEGMEIKVDGVAVPLEGLGSALPVDPGERVVDATAPGYRAWSTKVNVVSGTGASVSVPPMVIDPNAPKDDKGKVIVINNADQPKGTDSTKLIVGATTTGVGAIAIGIGAYLQFGLAADLKSQSDTFKTDADPSNDAQGATKLSQAKTNSAIGITLMAVGAVAIGAGIFLIVTSFRGGSEPPKPPQAAGIKLVPLVGGTNGLAAVGTF